MNAFEHNVLKQSHVFQTHKSGRMKETVISFPKMIQHEARGMLKDNADCGYEEYLYLLYKEAYCVTVNLQKITICVHCMGANADKIS